MLRFWAIAERWPDKLNSTTPLVAAAEAGEFGDVIVMELPDTDDEGNEVTPLPDPWPDTPAEEQVNALFLPLVTQ